MTKQLIKASGALLVTFALMISAGVTAQPSKVTVTRLLDHPLIGPDADSSIGKNIQGPSLIKVPDWLPNKMGNYYLYFADHKGLYIRLAYADSIIGPWQIYEPGSLQISDSYFTQKRPAITKEALDEMIAARRASGVQVSHDLAKELTEPHIASPDVHIDAENQRIVMYFHGLEGPGFQHSRVATSEDGIHFSAKEENIGRSYMRVFPWQGMFYAISMPGQFYRSADGLTDFEQGPVLFTSNMRHSAVLVRGQTLYVFWTRVGDAPESILLSTIDISDDWNLWRESGEQILLRPETDWEGANEPVEPSVRSTAYGRVNQLRDPALFLEHGTTYLLYAVAGESGIGLARVDFE
ncbi:MAG: hypothetical protein CMD92_03460 [Gammaproteobacteria bacterium]|nr:hypothetical protein [Gammaproteobacteria bacterium]